MVGLLAPSSLRSVLTSSVLIQGCSFQTCMCITSDVSDQGCSSQTCLLLSQHRRCQQPTPAHVLNVDVTDLLQAVCSVSNRCRYPVSTYELSSSTCVTPAMVALWHAAAQLYMRLQGGAQRRFTLRMLTSMSSSQARLVSWTTLSTSPRE